MVALETPAATGPALRSHRRGGPRWSVAAGVLLVVGLGLRLAVGGAGVGDRSATVMALLLTVGVWLAAIVLTTARTAFLVTLGLVVLLDLAALPAANAPVYDDRQAFYRTDQVLATQVPIDPGLARTAAGAQPMLLLLVEPVFPASAAQPRFALAGEVGGAVLAWDCTFPRGIQQLALPLPPMALAGAGTVDVRLQLTGSPSRESDYLLVYASAPRGGFLLSLVAAADGGTSTTTCSLRS